MPYKLPDGVMNTYSADTYAAKSKPSQGTKPFPGREKEFADRKAAEEAEIRELEAQFPTKQEESNKPPNRLTLSQQQELRNSSNKHDHSSTGYSAETYGDQIYAQRLNGKFANVPASAPVPPQSSSQRTNPTSSSLSPPRQPSQQPGWAKKLIHDIDDFGNSPEGMTSRLLKPLTTAVTAAVTSAVWGGGRTKSHRSPYEKRSRDELVALCKQRKLVGYSSKNKADLIKLLRKK